MDPDLRQDLPNKQQTTSLTRTPSSRTSAAQIRDLFAVNHGPSPIDILNKSRARFFRMTLDATTTHYPNITLIQLPVSWHGSEKTYFRTKHMGQELWTAETGFEEAKRRITECRERKAKALDLGGLALKALPEEIYELDWLETLYLGGDAAHRAEPYYPFSSSDETQTNALTELNTSIGIAFLNLRNLDLAGNSIGDKGAEAISKLSSLSQLNLWENNIGDNGAKAISKLSSLTQLDLYNNSIGKEGAEAISRLSRLTKLDLDYNSIGDKGAVAISKLSSLTQLDLFNNSIEKEGAEAISKLSSLTWLNLNNNSIGDKGADALSKLSSLTRLNLWNNSIGDKGAEAISKLSRLTKLDLDSNSIGDNGAEAISKLSSLTQLNLSGNRIGDKGAEAISKLSSLTQLYLSSNSIGDKGAEAISKLSSLTQLYLSSNRIGDKGAEALSKLSSLIKLNLNSNNIGDRGVAVILGISSIEVLALSRVKISGSTAFSALSELRELTLLSSELSDIDPQFWHQPNLTKVVLHETDYLGVPNEVLSKYSFKDCLPDLRAHFQSLEQGTTTLDDVKLMILGNGQIGKTQLARRLRRKPFDRGVKTTHGIQIRPTKLTRKEASDIPLKIWDFGGQDIYLGTHASLLRTRAVFLAVWAEVAEYAPTHKVGTHESRNFPLDYWVQYIGDMAGYESPGIIVQTQCDSEDSETLPPLTPELGNRFTPKLKPVAFSAQSDIGLKKLKSRILKAAEHILENRPEIGKGWAAVKADMERRLGKGEKRLALSEFRAVCKKKAKIGDHKTAMILLNFLHELGTVFYDEALFDNWIILDQQWALDAIYTLFDREEDGVYEQLTQLTFGRFKPSQLALLAWDKAGHDKEDQNLFLQMMLSCDLCFEYRPSVPDKDIETSYIAPQLLPETPALPDTSQTQWAEAGPAKGASYKYAQHVPGLFHRVMAKLGGLAGIGADYWKNGIQLFDMNTQAYARLIQDEDASTISVETRGGQAELLLAWLSDIVEAEQEQRNLKSERTPPRTEPRLSPEGERSGAAKRGASPDLAKNIRPGTKGSEKDQIYVSYSWADAKSEQAIKDHASSVEAICTKAEQKGVIIQRDIDRIKPGQKISRFMKDLATGSKIVIILTPSYLKSRYCMFELHEIWRRCEQEDTTFLKRIEVYNVEGKVRLEALDRLKVQKQWVKAHKELVEAIEDLDWKEVSPATRRVADELKEFASKTDEILAVINDSVQWRTLESIDMLVLRLGDHAEKD